MTLAILFQISKEDTTYLNLFKGVLRDKDCKPWFSDATPTTVTEVLMRAKERKCSCVATSEPKLLQLLLGQVGGRLPSLDDYQGSIIEFKGVEFLILPPVKHLVTVPYGRFLYSRYLSKFLAPNNWLPLPEFFWTVFNEADTEFYIDTFAAANFIAVDIETGHEDLRVITCVGMTAVTLSSTTGTVKTETIVIPFTSDYNVAVIATLLSLPPFKVFQNGKYDNAYFLRFGLPVYNWGGDTLNLFHSWLSELPKDLAFISAFTLRKWQFWKDESKTTDLMEYYRYNAKDSFATAMSWLSMLVEAPSYAVENYKQEFPLVFPCLLTEMTGLLADREEFKKEEDRFSVSLELQLASLRKMVAVPAFNPSSPKQVLELFAILGSEDIKSSDAKNVDRVGDRHPLNKRIVRAIKKYREDRKMLGTYLRMTDTGGRDVLWHNRMFFALSPSATDTGRLASRESAFWCGQNIQNWPRDRVDIEVKNCIVSDPGFLFGEGDYRQNENWGTAFLSGDKKLIEVVQDSSKDFHGVNASEFFGIPYERIVESKYDTELAEWVHKTVDKVIRNDIGKRVNHGANYNMGPQVLIDTMTIENVRRAKLLLKLPENWSLLRVAEYLLAGFDRTYPVVRGLAYEKVINAVTSTGFLIGPTGWTRRCFGNPRTNKHWFNAYVAHGPQSLAAMQLNLAYLAVFNSVAVRWPQDFKLGPQIHDSILFQYRIGRLDLAQKVKDCMRVPIEVLDTFGIRRELAVPVDIKGESNRWSKVVPLRLTSH